MAQHLDANSPADIAISRSVATEAPTTIQQSNCRAYHRQILPHHDTLQNRPQPTPATSLTTNLPDLCLHPAQAKPPTTNSTNHPRTQLQPTKSHCHLPSSVEATQSPSHPPPVTKPSKERQPTHHIPSWPISLVDFHNTIHKRLPCCPNLLLGHLGVKWKKRK